MRRASALSMKASSFIRLQGPHHTVETNTNSDLPWLFASTRAASRPPSNQRMPNSLRSGDAWA